MPSLRLVCCRSNTRILQRLQELVMSMTTTLQEVGDSCITCLMPVYMFNFNLCTSCTVYHARHYMDAIHEEAEASLTAAISEYKASEVDPAVYVI